MEGFELLLLIFVLLLVLFILFIKTNNKVESHKQIDFSNMNDPEVRAYLIKLFQNINFSYLISNYFKDLENDLSMSLDDVISLKDDFLHFISLNNIKFGEDISQYNYHTISKAFIKISNHEPNEHVCVLDFRDPFNIISRYEHVNNRYYLKRRVASNSFKDFFSILKKRQSFIEEHFDVSLCELVLFYELFVKALYDMMTRRDSNYVLFLDDFSELDIEIIKKIIHLLSNENGVRLYIIEEYIVATDFAFFIDNFYELIEEKLNNTTVVEKIRKDRGFLFEKLVFNSLKSKVDVSAKNLVLDGMEFDLLFINDDIIGVLEIKSLLYSSQNFEKKETRNNLKKSVKKAIEQLYKRVNLLLDNDKIIIDNKDFVLSKYKILPLIIVSDDLYEISHFTCDEALDNNFKFNPLVLSYDDFIGMMRLTDNVKQLLEYLFKRTSEKQVRKIINDELTVYYMRKYSINIDSITLRNLIFFENLLIVLIYFKLKNIYLIILLLIIKIILDKILVFKPLQFKVTNWKKYYSKKPLKIVEKKRLNNINYILKVLKENNFKGGKVLEYGGGNSSVAEAISKNYNIDKFTIVDSNEYGIELLDNKNIKNLNKKCESIFDYNDKIEYDLIYSVGLIEHFQGKELEKCIKRHFKYAKNNSLVLFTFPVPKMKYKVIRFIYEIFNKWQYTDEVPLKKVYVEYLLKKHGKILYSEVNKGLILPQAIILVKKG